MSPTLEIRTFFLLLHEVSSETAKKDPPEGSKTGIFGPKHYKRRVFQVSRVTAGQTINRGSGLGKLLIRQMSSVCTYSNDNVH